MHDARGSDRSEFLTIQGRGTSPGLACGPLVRNHREARPEQVHGSILIAERAVPDDVGRIMASAGTITLGGSVLSHVSLLSREFGKPSVSLGTYDRAWLLSEDGAGLIDLSDSADAKSALVEEGDVVLLDGDRGTLRIPGARITDERKSVRRLHALLLHFARDPEDLTILQRIEEAVRDPQGPELPFLLEAGLLYRLVPEGEPTRLLLETLSAACSRPELLEPRLALLRARVLASVASRHDRAEEALRVTRDPEEVVRIVASFASFLARARALLLDLGSSATELDRLREGLGAKAESRRAFLAAELRGEIEAALALTEEAFEERAASLYPLVRRAHGARISDPLLGNLAARLQRRSREHATEEPVPLVVPLERAAAYGREVVGGKVAGLLEVGHLLPAGCRIPRGFVVTSAAYRQHLQGEIGEQLRTCLREGEDEAQVSRLARAALLAGEIPPAVVREVAAALEGVASARLAVRSSATVEDGPAGSLAGQFDTFLGVRGLPELLNRIRWAWVSLWNVRALRALEGAGLSPLEACQAVLVQEMIETRAAGVLVSRDAARGADTLLVNAAFGLGEGISQGGIPGDLFWVRRSTGELLASEPGAGARQVVLDPLGTGTVECLLPPDKAGRLCLSVGQLSRLSALARALEGAHQAVRDVEFGFTEDDELVVFQIRPAFAPGSRGAAL